VVDGFRGLVLEELCGVFGGGLEVVLIYEFLNFRVVLLVWEYNNGIVFLCCGFSGAVFL
jgi:hypothetical protein